MEKLLKWVFRYFLSKIGFKEANGGALITSLITYSILRGLKSPNKNKLKKANYEKVKGCSALIWAIC